MTARQRFPKFDRPTHIVADASKPWSRPTAVTLFSGLGSSSAALRSLGFHVLAHDFMPEAAASLQANGFDVVQGDIREVDFTEPLYDDVQVVVGGPPCQPFSQGGRNKGADDERDMIPDFLRCVAQTQPRLFILENVRGLASPRHKDYLERRVSEFEALGYVVEWRVLDAADHGVAQSRKRLFMIGVRKDFAEARSAWVPAIWWPRRQPQITMARALGWDLREAYRRNQQAPEAARCHALRDDEHWRWVFQRPSTTVVGSFKPEVQAAPGYRSAGDGPRQNAPGSVVTTKQERLILQGLPPDWKVCGSKTKVDLQIGNSCPLPLLQRLLSLNI